MVYTKRKGMAHLSDMRACLYLIDEFINMTNTIISRHNHSKTSKGKN